MAAIFKELTIQAAPRQVWDALTQPEEIARWWTDDLSTIPEVGSLSEFYFSKRKFVIQFEVAELEQDKKVHWLSRKGPPHWVGTSITWQLEPVQNGTRVIFTHDGFTQVDMVYEQTQGNWEYFLGSLKSYLETGKGTPGFPVFV